MSGNQFDRHATSTITQNLLFYLQKNHLVVFFHPQKMTKTFFPLISLAAIFNVSPLTEGTRNLQLSIQTYNMMQVFAMHVGKLPRDDL